MMYELQTKKKPKKYRFVFFKSLFCKHEPPYESLTAEELEKEQGIFTHYPALYRCTKCGTLGTEGENF